MNRKQVEKAVEALMEIQQQVQKKIEDISVVTQKGSRESLFVEYSCHDDYEALLEVRNQISIAIGRVEKMENGHE